MFVDFLSHICVNGVNGVTGLCLCVFVQYVHIVTVYSVHTTSVERLSLLEGGGGGVSALLLFLRCLPYCPLLEGISLT